MGNSNSKCEVFLEPFLETDIEKLISWVDCASSTDLWASRTYVYPLSRERVLRHLSRTQKKPFELFVFKIISCKESKTVGHVELDKVDHHGSSARVTRLFVEPEYRGRGVAYQAIIALLDFCFRDLELHRIEILAIETNQPALELYKKIGFKEEGFLRENMLLQNRRYSSYLLSMLRSEFLEEVTLPDKVGAQ